MELKQKLRSGLNFAKRGAKNGFFHIFAGNTMVKIISALSVLLLPAIISRRQYGAFTLPDNYINLVTLFNGLGISTAILRYCAVFEGPGEKKAYFGFSVKFGVMFDLMLIAAAGLLLYVLNAFGVYTITPLEAQLLAGLALTPILAFVLDTILNFLRSTRENRKYSKIAVLFTGCFALFQVILALIFQVYGIIPGRYIAYIVTIIVGICMLRTLPAFKENEASI